MTESKRRPSRVANDAPTRIKHALWRWSEDQDQLSIGPKAFLNHATDHADDEGRFFVVSRHFQRLMSASPRSITNYLRKLEAYELIAKTGDHIIFPGVQLPIYRLAPNDPEVSALINCSEGSASPEAASETSELGKSGTQVSSSDVKVGKAERAYKENSTYSNYNTQGDASALGVKSAEPSVPEPPCDPSTFEPALAFYSLEFLEDFSESFASHLVEHFLGSAKACPNTETLHPDTPNSHGWFRTKAAGILARHGIQLGKPWKLLACG